MSARARKAAPRKSATIAATPVATFPIASGFRTANIVHAGSTAAGDVYTVLADAADDFGDAYTARMAKLEREAASKQSVANVEYAARRAAAKAAIAALA